MTMHARFPQTALAPARAAKAPGTSGPAFALELALALLLASLLAACASPGPNAPAARRLEPQRVGASDVDRESFPWPGVDAWKSLGDERLAALIDTALADSPTLGVAAARLQRARGIADAADALREPQVTGSVSSTRQRLSENALLSPAFGGRTLSVNDVLINASWELDFFGRHRAALESALGQFRAVEADVQAARVLLASQVARAWFQLARVRAQREVAVATLRQREQLVELVGQRVRAGLDTYIELRQAESAVPDTRRAIEALDEQGELARNALAALTAQPAQALATLAPELPRGDETLIPSAIPADLVGRRADIVAARWRVESAAQDVLETRSQFYPNVNLAAFAGVSALGFDKLFDLGSRTYGGGPAIRLPIFDAGRLRASLGGRRADVDAAIETYNGAIVDAVREVADQLATLRSLERQMAEQRSAQTLSETALDLAMQRYRAGLGNYLTVLAAETAVLAQRSAAVDLTARRIDARVNLVRALGGGYDEAASASAPTRASATARQNTATATTGPRPANATTLSDARP